MPLGDGIRRDTQKPTIMFAVTRVRFDDDDKAFHITFSAADNCPGVTVSGLIDIECRHRIHCQWTDCLD
jgi:hypothetical protein